MFSGDDGGGKRWKRKTGEDGKGLMNEATGF